MNVTTEFHFTVKPECNDHPQDPKIVADVDRFRGSIALLMWKMERLNSGRCRQVVVIRRWSLAQVSMYIDMRVCVGGGSKNILPF
jgi:hypothetical protein